MLISSKDIPACSSFLKVSANHLLNLSIMIPFTHLFTVKSRTWKSTVMLFGTYCKLFCFLSTMMSPTQSSDLGKRPILKVQTDQNFYFFFLSASTYGMTISFKCFKTSSVLLWCFMLALKQKSVGKVTFFKDCLVFPL